LFSFAEIRIYPAVILNYFKPLSGSRLLESSSWIVSKIRKRSEKRKKLARDYVNKRIKFINKTRNEERRFTIIVFYNNNARWRNDGKWRWNI